jgi:subtilisin family serine protease
MKKLLLSSVAIFAVVAAASEAAAGTDRSAAWQAQIGDTAAVQTQSNGGSGITIAFVDTGAVAANAEIANRVSPTSSCAAVTFTCSNGSNDDNGHGTATASIAAGQFSSTAPTSMSGVAPKAVVIAEKSLSASGAGYDTDIASGIVKATNAGAQVINLSVTYTPTSAVVNAINYATAHNAVIVWAGGNSAVNLDGGANTTGLSSAALSRLIFVGSVNSSSVLSSFSNKPGTAYAYAGTTRAAYSQLWLTAPGESIVAPAVMFGSSAYGSWTGTSMSTPEVAGAIALLESTWPVLARNGTASAVLFASATDLGASGVDKLYGHGLLDIARAFQPIGTTSVVTSTGQTATVSVLSGQVLTAGALGSIPQLRSRLSAYTTFDSFQRNFTTNLSRLVVTPKNGSSAAAAAVGSSPTVTHTVNFADGGYLTLSQTPSAPSAETDFSGASQTGDRPTGIPGRGTSYVAFVDRSGDMLAVGEGVSGMAAFAQAAWGPGSIAAEQTDGLGVSAALLGLAQGGRIGAVGVGLGPDVRLSAGWSATDPLSGAGGALTPARSAANAAMVGINARVNARLSLGASFGALSEDNALLGATYEGAGILSLGGRHASRSVSVSAALDLGGGRSVLVDAAWARTNGANPANGVIQDVSSLQARAYGVSLVQQDALRAGDRMTLSFRRPMRLVSGVASLAITSVDKDGYPSTSFTPISLTPNGSETDVSLDYWAPLNSQLSVGGGVDLRQDAHNVRGENDAGLQMAMKLSF